ncbi:MAG: hypothetical protein GX042_10115 [Bacteroidales bacterium]|jgi:hypothetical protein|nr:hypothetical protein [Bacteroidales bacterium]
MKTIYLSYLLFSFLLLLSACENDDAILTPADLIESIQSEVRQDNSLRVDITITFLRETEYSISYWPTDDESLKKETMMAQANGKAVATLVLLEPDRQYSFSLNASSGNAQVVSDIYSFTTRPLPSDVPVYNMIQNRLDEEIPGYVLQVRMDKPGYITLMNSEGEVLWYQNMEKAVKVANFDPATNTFFAILGDHPEKEYTGDWIVVMDLFGNIVLERESGDLYPHHEIRRMPDGNLLVVNFVPRKYDLSMWGGDTDETVWGDGFTILDIDGKILYQWDCFEEMDPRDDPDIMKMVAITSVLENPIWYKDDWLHANSVNFDEEGNFYMTFNWLNQLWKINKTTGDVEYRVGIDGNIEITESAYTSGIHTAMPLKQDQVLLIDNGSTRQKTRALIYDVDKTSQKADLLLDVALPKELSSAYMSSVQKIGNDMLMFGSTFPCAVIYTDMKGEIKRVITGLHQSYRAEYIAEISY